LFNFVANIFIPFALSHKKLKQEIKGKKK